MPSGSNANYQPTASRGLISESRDLRAIHRVRARAHLRLDRQTRLEKNVIIGLLPQQFADLQCGVKNKALRNVRPEPHPVTTATNQLGKLANKQPKTLDLPIIPLTKQSSIVRSDRSIKVMLPTDHVLHIRHSLALGIAQNLRTHGRTERGCDRWINGCGWRHGYGNQFDGEVATTKRDIGYLGYFPLHWGGPLTRRNLSPIGMMPCTRIIRINCST